MRLYEICFFQDSFPPPKLIIDTPRPGDPWTNTIKLEMVDEYYNPSTITFFLRNESALISFVNSVKSAYNKYRKDQGYDR